MSGEIRGSQPSTEATYETYKTRAQGQARSIEVASLNLKSIDGLHKLEGQTIDIAVTAKNNETQIRQARRR